MLGNAAVATRPMAPETQDSALSLADSSLSCAVLGEPISAPAFYGVCCRTLTHAEHAQLRIARRAEMCSMRRFASTRRPD